MKKMKNEKWKIADEKCEIKNAHMTCHNDRIEDQEK